MSLFQQSFSGALSLVQPVKNFFEDWTTTKSLVALAAVAGTALVVGSILTGDGGAAWKESVTSTSLDHILNHAQGAYDWGNTLIQKGAELTDPDKLSLALTQATGLLKAAPGTLSDAAQASYNSGVHCVSDLVKPGAASDAITAAVKHCAATPFKL